MVEKLVMNSMVTTGFISLVGAVALALYVNHKPKIHSKPQDGISQLIGNTKLIRIKSLSDATGCNILAKMEMMNIGGSPKDRVALRIVRDAESKGLITPFSGCTLFEGTVGSTGISLATVANALGYNCYIVMPDDGELIPNSSRN
jgi:cysteine synthase A